MREPVLVLSAGELNKQRTRPSTQHLALSTRSSEANE